MFQTWLNPFFRKTDPASGKPYCDYLSIHSIIIILFILLSLGIFIPNFILSSQLKQDSLAINLAGRQRMLSQRIVKALLTIQYQQQQGEDLIAAQNELALSYQLFDQTLEGFASGGKVYDADEKLIFLNPVSSKKTRQSVQEAFVIWFPYRQKLQPILNHQISPGTLRQAIIYAKRENLNLLDLMNQLTVDLEKEAQFKALILQVFQGVSLVFALGLICLLTQNIQELKSRDQRLKLSQFKLKKKAEKLEKTIHQLKQTQTQLVQSEKMSSLGKMVAGIAHEINNPINFIHGNINYASENVKDLLNLVQQYQAYYPNPSANIQIAIEEMDFMFVQEDLPKLLSSMQNGTKRVREIVKSLRTFSRLDESELKNVNIHESIDSCLMLLEHRLASSEKDLEIEVIKNYKSLPPIHCYPGQLNQVFMHILENAIDAIRERWSKHHCLSRDCLTNLTLPQIKIHTEPVDHQEIKITITDNGCGIKKETLPQIFDPFFTTKPIGKATGLGLAISYQVVVEKHRGQLTSNSILGQGTEFVIQIPIKQL